MKLANVLLIMSLMASTNALASEDYCESEPQETYDTIIERRHATVGDPTEMEAAIKDATSALDRGAFEEERAEWRGTLLSHFHNIEMTLESMGKAKAAVKGLKGEKEVAAYANLMLSVLPDYRDLVVALYRALGDKGDRAALKKTIAALNAKIKSREPALRSRTDAVGAALKRLKPEDLAKAFGAFHQSTLVERCKAARTRFTPPSRTILEG